MSLQEEEQAAAAGASGAPRVSLADIESNIAEKYFVTGDVAVNRPEVGADNPLSLLTLCVCVTKSGFTVVGKSACVSPENFDRELGQRIAYNDCVDQLWPLMGYALREELSRTQDGAPDEFKAEADRLSDEVAAAKTAD